VNTVPISSYGGVVTRKHMEGNRKMLMADSLCNVLRRIRYYISVTDGVLIYRSFATRLSQLKIWHFLGYWRRKKCLQMHF
jgi:hypothetical protein